MKLLHGVSLASYRAAATLIARYLARHEFVEGVYLHRSVATGEVSFGQSDIDLLLVLNSPEQGAAMASEMGSFLGMLAGCFACIPDCCTYRYTTGKG